MTTSPSFNTTGSGRILGLFFIVFCFNSFFTYAQVGVRDINYDATPAHKWEMGVHVGHLFCAGDITYNPGFAGGVHIRRALDYVFSMRGDFNYGWMQGERFSGNNAFRTTWTSATMHAMVSLNNLKWDEPSRRTNIYVYVGGGGNQFSADFKEEAGGGSKDVDKALSPVLDIGFGLSIRLNENINIGVDHKFSTLFSKYADQIDAFENQGFRDMTNYTSIRLNYNIGKKDHAEPLYWVNPLKTFIDDITDLKARPDFIPSDSDGDGVMDIFDLEPETPFGAQVDTRGITLDSDGDKIPNHEDLEPYSPPNFEYDSKGVAIKPLPSDTAAASEQGLSLFLPIIHFKTNQFDIRETEYSKLDYLSRLLSLYQDIRLSVIGYADRIGTEQYNNEISYQRAVAVIDFLTSRLNVPRNRLVLIWKGEQDAIVVDDEDSYMNRRVEFNIVSPDLKDMEPPKTKEKKGY